MIRISITKVEEVWKKSRKWERVTDNIQAERQYDYIDAELPQIENALLLDQIVPDEAFDMAAVIKAINKL